MLLLHYLAISIVLPKEKIFENIVFKFVLLDRFGMIDSGRSGSGERDIIINIKVKFIMKEGIQVF